MPEKQIVNDRPDPQEPPPSAGDNRRAGDTDGNASGGNSKSKGAENPPAETPTKDREKAHES